MLKHWLIDWFVVSVVVYLFVCSWGRSRICSFIHSFIHSLLLLLLQLQLRLLRLLLLRLCVYVSGQEGTGSVVVWAPSSCIRALVTGQVLWTIRQTNISLIITTRISSSSSSSCRCRPTRCFQGPAAPSQLVCPSPSFSAFISLCQKHGCKNLVPVFFKSQDGGFYWVPGILVLNPGSVRRPNLTCSGISMGFQLFRWALLGRYSRHQTNVSLVSLLVKNSLNFYAPQLYRQVLLRRVLAMGILSVRLSVRPSVTARCRNNRVT